MARTTLNPASITTAGLVPALVNADNVNGMSYQGKAGRFVWVKNTNAAVCNLTVHAGPSGTLDSGAAPDRVIVVPATTGERLCGPFSGEYVQADGSIQLDFSVGGATTLVGVVDVNG